MHAKKILFPTDFSTLSDAALRHATVLAHDMGAKLIIVHVEEPPAAYGAGEMYYGMPDPDMPALTKMLEAVVPSDPQGALRASHGDRRPGERDRDARQGRRRRPDRDGHARPHRPGPVADGKRRRSRGPPGALPGLHVQGKPEDQTAMAAKWNERHPCIDDERNEGAEPGVASPGTYRDGGAQGTLPLGFASGWRVSGVARASRLRLPAPVPLLAVDRAFADAL